MSRRLPALGGFVARILPVALLVPATALSEGAFSTRWSIARHDPTTLAADCAQLAAARPLAPARQAADGSRCVWVYFTDKGIASETAYAAACAKAEATLTSDARERRAIVAEGALVDFLDLPVVDSYLAAVAATGARLRHPSRWLNAVSVDATPTELKAIAALPFVTRLQPVAQGRRSPLPAPTPEKSFLPVPESSNVLSYGPSLAQLDEIQVPSVHNLGFSGAGVIVAMLDTGYFKDHEAFTAIRNSGRLIAERDFINGDGNTQNQAGDTPTQHNHGTYTWSALGGQMAGELYGPAYGAKFALAKTEDVTDEQPIEEDHWLAASEWADSLGARVISSSLGYLDWYTYEDMNGHTAVTTRAADIAARRNIVVATAAGNEGQTEWHYIIAPADADSVLAVGAVNNLNEVADFSSYGPTFDGRVKPEVVARGRDTHCATTLSTDTYGDLSGTSLSTPLVGGAAALVIEAHPTWSAWKVRYALIRTADNFATPDDRRGFGRIRVLNAINLSFVGVEDGEAPAFGVRLAVNPNPFATSGAIEIEMPSAGPLAVALYSADGRQVRALSDGTVPAGLLRLRWDGRDALGRSLPAGIYFLRAAGPSWTRVAKVALTH